MPKFSGRGGKIRWQRRNKGKTWFLWERLEGRSTIVGKVAPIGKEFRAVDFGSDYPVVLREIGIFRSVSLAKKALERALRVSER